MLEVRDVRFTYEDAPLLRGIDLTVEAGESVFLLGPSGVGKSTLLRCIAGLERPDAGTVHLDGQDLDRVPVHLRRIGMMFQEPALFPHLDVTANVSFGLRYRNAPGAEPNTEAQRFLDLVDLGHKAGAHVDELSGGERQRVALARTLAAAPKAVLLDEPLSALDRPLREALGDRTKELLREQGIPALWVTHDDQEAARLGDRVLRLADGRLIVNS